MTAFTLKKSSRNCCLWTLISEIPAYHDAGGRRENSEVLGVLGWAATGLELVLILSGFVISYFRG